jgi:DNA processing protein
MFDQICESGAVITELAPGSSPTKWRFLQRNRLIAALGQVTLIIEAGSRSGSINTANHATSLGRPIAAVPGPITSSSSAGTNRLIAESIAQLVSNPADVAALAGDSEYLTMQPAADELGDLEKRALDAVGTKTVTAAEIAQRAGLTAQELGIAMGQLLLSGRVSQSEGGYFKPKQTTI